MAADDDKFKTDDLPADEAKTEPTTDEPVASEQPESPDDTKSEMDWKPTEDDDRAANAYQPEAEPEPTFQPKEADQSAPVSSEPTAAAPFSDGGKRKKLWVAVAASAVVVLLASGAGAWWWYNSPDKVLTDATRHLMSTPVSSASGNYDISSGPKAESQVSLKGDYEFKSAADKTSQFTTNLTIDTEQADNLSLSADFITSPEGDSYIKVGKLRQLIESLLGSAGYTTEQQEMMMSLYGGMINKVDDQWVKLSQEELEELQSGQTESDQEIACYQQALADFQSNKQQQDEMLADFDQNRFLLLDKQLASQEIDGRDSVGYAMKLDETKAEAFGESIKDNGLIKKLEDCGADFSDDGEESTDESSASVSFELWVDKWNHQYTQITMKATDDEVNLKLDLRPHFGEPKTVEVPQDFTTMDELKKEIEASLMNMMGGSAVTS